MHVVRIIPLNAHSALRWRSPVLKVWHGVIPQTDSSSRTNLSLGILRPHAALFARGPGDEDQNRNLVMPTLASVWKAVDSQFLPIALALSLTAGYSLPEIAVRADAANVCKLSTFVIFVISGAWYCIWFLA